MALRAGHPSFKQAEGVFRGLYTFGVLEREVKVYGTPQLARGKGDVPPVAADLCKNEGRRARAWSHTSVGRKAMDKDARCNFGGESEHRVCTEIEGSEAGL